MSAEQGNVQSWREAEVLIRESLLDGTVGGDLSEVRYNRAIMALTALTAQIEERDKRIEELRAQPANSVEWMLVVKDERDRAEKAERALAALQLDNRDVTKVVVFFRSPEDEMQRFIEVDPTVLRPSEEASDEFRVTPGQKKTLDRAASDES